MLILAHRGASAEAPENTLAAFTRAIDAQADGIELDVYQVDGEIYVFHDRYLERLTAHPGRLQDLTKEQIRTLRVFGQQAVPTLLEALTLIAGRCLVNVELKGNVDIAKLSDCLSTAIKHLGFATEQFIVSSFNHHWLQAIKHQLPWLRIGALTASNLLSYAAFATELNAYSMHCCVDFISPELIADAHQRGLLVLVYTVDEAHDIEWLRELEVDGIFTNHPSHARHVLAGLPVSDDELLRHF